MELHFTGEVWYWRGPSPFHFVTVPDDASDAIADVASLVTYGWGMIPVTGRIGSTEFTTSLWPKDGGYIVPIKKAVQIAQSIDVGDDVDVELVIEVQAP
ncbi:hypothetical protein GCM10025867_30400 [Frondihabitans sucicola]|uniref:DUF1905 domain-containing protein n=1 Tax=Frondihabitans sucicola TaxID=1268041 RepID=A0ABM8GQR4_9MICO|nr:DUF1905 domain-containing protein [Frondihabitans sucicola]BDZ50799.1 hypothetical protein GCM10025867_30400 [Frondihabitans sucicola]